MYQFNNNIITHVPTSCLIEDYQTLQQAMNALDAGDIDDTKDLINTTMECLAGIIDKLTETPKDLNIKPSVSSLIAMSCQEGILTDKTGQDFRCMNNQPVSMAMAGGCCQCDESCPYYHLTCEPESGRIQLRNRFLCKPGSAYDEYMLRNL